MFHRLLVANRGIAAMRILRACDAMGVTPVLAVSQADADAPYVRERQSIVLGPAAAAESYLDSVRLVQAAVQTQCSALHPGWGFLSQDPLLATLCVTHGVTFVGPAAAAMHRLGDKLQAKRLMREAGVTVIAGGETVLASADEAAQLAASIGYPVLLKARSGGGGRGMRLVRQATELHEAYDGAAQEALAAFGDASLYLEQYIEGGRHVELQIIADHYGKLVHLGERDCSIQRNHQKLIEETPAPTIAAEQFEDVAAATLRALRSAGYVNAGTVEFLVGADGIWRFMEMNTRLQVEHGISELRYGVDLVVEQLRVAARQPLSWRQEELRGRGHVIECRINAEDPANGFRPCPGRIARWRSPSADADLRVETMVESGYEVLPFYDSLICQLLACGADREQARRRMLGALDSLVCEGIATTATMQRAILQSADFIEHRYDTRRIPGWP